MIKVFYYYYYLFYTKVLPDDEPHATVIFSLSFLFAIIVNGIINFALAFVFESALSKWEMIGTFLFILILMYFRFFRKSKGQFIIEQKPKILNRNDLSVFASVALFVIGMIFLFGEAGLVGNILGTR